MITNEALDLPLNISRVQIVSVNSVATVRVNLNGRFQNPNVA